MGEMEETRGNGGKKQRVSCRHCRHERHAVVPRPRLSRRYGWNLKPSKGFGTPLRRQEKIEHCRGVVSALAGRRLARDNGNAPPEPDRGRPGLYPW